MGQNGIPLFFMINKKVFFGGRNVPFRYGTNVPPVHLYRSRNGTFLPPADAMMMEVNRNQMLLLR